MSRVNRRWRKQPKFSLGGSKQQLIRGGSGSGLAQATNTFHCLSPYPDDSSAEDGKFFTAIGKGKTRLVDNKTKKSYACPFEVPRRKLAECDIKQVIPEGIIKEEGTLCCTNKLDLLTSEVDENAREYTDNELVYGFSDLKMNISYSDEPLSRMNHKGVNLVYVKDSIFFSDFSELDRPKNGSYDYVLLEKAHPWSSTYVVDVDYTKLETQSPSISCNLDKDQQDSKSICVGADIEHRLEVASEGIEIHINNGYLDLDEITNLGGSINDEDDIYGDQITCEEADIYSDQLTFNRSPAKFWVDREFHGNIVSKPEEIDKLNRNLALHRIKAYEVLLHDTTLLLFNHI